jgi:hypothetical protein
MNKTTQIISWISYTLSVLLLSLGFIFRSEHLLFYLSNSCLILMIPWIICIVNSLKPKNHSYGLWPYLLFFFGLVTIPIYLIQIQKNNNPGQNK